MLKLVVYVPVQDAYKVRNAMMNAGAGVIGNYTNCSVTMEAWGRFIPQSGAQPAIGSIGTESVVSEQRIETICQENLARKVMAAARKACSYETLPIELYNLVNEEDLP